MSEIEVNDVLLQNATYVNIRVQRNINIDMNMQR